MAISYPSMDQKSHEEKQRTDATEDCLQEKKEEFLHVVRALGLRPWMLKVLVNHGVKEAKEVDPKVLGCPPTEDKETTQKKRQQFRLLVRKLHPSPWMLAALMDETNISTEQKIEVAMKKPNEKRIKFRQLVRKLGPAPWMLRVLANNGVPSVPDVDASAFNPMTAKGGVTEENRKELRKAIKEIGPKPWMVDVVVNQAKVPAKEQVVERKISEAPEETDDNMDDKQKVGAPRKNRMKFRQLVKKLGPASWMFRVFANNGVHGAREVDTSVFSNLPTGNEMTNERRKELRSLVKEIGPKPWMVDVVINQAKTLLNPKQQEKDQAKVEKYRFRDLVTNMGCRPWMFKVLGNNGVPEAKAVKLSEFQFASHDEEECNIQVKRQAFRKTVRTMGPKPWMLKVLIEQCESSNDLLPEKTGQPDRNQNDVVDKRREFRQIVRKLKPGAWMMKVLSNNGVQQVAQYPANVPDDKTNVEEKKAEFRQAIERIGPKPWMSKVVINQANIIAKVEKIKYPSTGHTDAEMSETEVKAECEKLKKNRRAFTEMVRQMGPKQWMLRVLFNQGLAGAKDVDITKDIRTNGESQDEIKPKRIEFRQFVRKIGPKPWMIKVVVKQAKTVAEKKIIEETTDDEKAAEVVKLDMKQCRREYSFVLKQMKLRPWMLKVLANHGVTEAEKVDQSIFEDRSSFNPAKEQQDRIQFRQLIKRIGPKPWMVRVLQNQAVISTAEKADLLNDKTPDNPKIQSEKEKKFREIVQQMGAESWMFNVLTNQMNKASKQSKVRTLLPLSSKVIKIILNLLIILLIFFGREGVTVKSRILRNWTVLIKG